MGYVRTVWLCVWMDSTKGPVLGLFLRMSRPWFVTHFLWKSVQNPNIVAENLQNLFICSPSQASGVLLFLQCSAHHIQLEVCCEVMGWWQGSHCICLFPISPVLTYMYQPGAFVRHVRTLLALRRRNEWKSFYNGLLTNVAFISRYFRVSSYTINFL